MSFIKSAAAILGVAMILVGLLWAGQGLGIIRWPASSFMLGDIIWTRNGTVLAVAGVVLTWFARKR
jgi:hypothetical protein